MTITDYEYLLILGFLVLSFFFGLRKKTSGDEGKSGFFCVDLEMSTAIKGIACVLVLMGHFAQRNFSSDLPFGVSKIVWYTTANIALSWFMFFSGYGLTLKDIRVCQLKNDIKMRLVKIYYPLLYTCVISMVVYFLLPDKFTLEEINKLFLPREIHDIKNLTLSNSGYMIMDLFGLFDWYVFCILIFYTFYYLACFLSFKTKWNITAILTVCMFGYFLFAYNYFGTERAHWFRYPWAFMLGHIIAKRKTKQTSNAISCLSMLLFLCCVLYLKEWSQLFSYLIAMVLLGVFGALNKNYTYKGFLLSSLGTVSYFFYLSHVRIGYPLLVYMSSKSVILWILISYTIALVLTFFYKHSKNIRRY